MKKITAGQKKIIWTIVRTNNIDEEGFRDWLQRDFDTRSTRALSNSQAEAVIRSLNAFIGKDHTKHLFTWGITERQIWRAKRLADELGWDDPRRLNGLIKKMFEKQALNQLNKTEGTKLIIGLERMLASASTGSVAGKSEIATFRSQ